MRAALSCRAATPRFDSGRFRLFAFFKPGISIFSGASGSASAITGEISGLDVWTMFLILMVGPSGGSLLNGCLLAGSPHHNLKNDAIGSPNSIGDVDCL